MLDLSKEAWADKMPPLGLQRSTIVDLDINEKSDATWAKVLFELTETGHQIEEFTCIDAPPTSPHVRNAARGRRLLLDIATAIDADPRFEDYEALRNRFVGQSVDLDLVKSTASGLPVAKIKSILKSQNNPE